MAVLNSVLNYGGRYQGPAWANPNNSGGGLMGAAASTPKPNITPTTVKPITPTILKPKAVITTTAKPKAVAPPASPAQVANTDTYTPVGYTASHATSVGYDPTMVDRTGITYDPTTQNVQDDQLVSNQLNGLLAGNGKYLQQARQSGLEQAQRSGLMTSSIAAGSAERSAIQAALPIAQGDASRFGSVADQNMAATNQAGQFDAGQTLNASGADASAQNAASAFKANAANSASQFDTNSDNQAAAFGASSSNDAAKANAAQVNAANQFNVNQFNQTATAQQQNALDNRKLDAQQNNNFIAVQNQREQELSTTVASIYSNPNLTPAQQQVAAGNAKTVLQGVWNATDKTFANGVPDIFAV